MTSPNEYIQMRSIFIRMEDTFLWPNVLRFDSYFTADLFKSDRKHKLIDLKCLKRHIDLQLPTSIKRQV